ncbi:MAG: SPOR domain-containing protein [Treponemataceae bacterium]|nr:SPOR domain-containing protein [Treponemataceae bacterium]
MEQKRTLWIIAAVGVFLLVVLGAALILYSPASQPARSIASRDSRNGTVSSNGWISLAPSTAAPALPSTVVPPSDDFNQNSGIDGSGGGLDVPPDNAASVASGSREGGAVPSATTVDEMTVIAGSATIYDMSARPSGYREPSAPAATTIDLNIGISGAEVASASVAASGARTSASPAPARTEPPAAAQKSAARSEKAAPAATVRTAQAPVKKASSGAASVPAARAEKTQYWVQVSSLTSRKNADNARAVLDENKIAADVFTYTDSKDQLFYRVRVGPYTTKSEAEYWRAKIAKIDTFSQTSSYVTSTTSAQ